MADTKISALTEDTAPDLDADFVVTVDTSTGLNKKVKPRTFGQWAVAASWTFSTNVTEVDFTGLSAYSELTLMFRAITLSNSTIIRLVVSSDNGSTWKTSSGEYSYIDNSGIATNDVAIYPYNTGHTAARSPIASIAAWNLAVPKPVLVTRTDFNYFTINDAEACNAIRCQPATGGNITGGSIYIYGR